MTNPTVPLSEASQRPNPDAFVSLYTLDASAIGGGIHRFCNSTDTDGGNISFGNVEYVPLNFKSEGFEWDGEAMPRPKITASIAGDTDLSAAFLDLVVGYKGAQGATLYRIRTLFRYLDGHEDADDTIQFPQDIYVVDRIISLTQTAVQWELIAATDLPNMKLPNRVALRDACQWIYRKWDASANHFVYDGTSMACPYTGAACYTKAGVSTTSANDECGHRFSDCALRYSNGAALPFGGFPGLERGNV